MSAFVEAMAFLRAMPAFAKADGVFLRAMPAFAEATAFLMAMPAFAKATVLLSAMPAFAEATAGDVERTGFEPPDSYRETPTL